MLNATNCLKDLDADQAAVWWDHLVQAGLLLNFEEVKSWICVGHEDDDTLCWHFVATNKEMIQIQLAYGEQDIVGKILVHKHYMNPVEKEKEFIILEGIKVGNRFFTTNHPETDQTKIENGTVAYRILGYANSVEEAQIKLYGRIYK